MFARDESNAALVLGPSGFGLSVDRVARRMNSSNENVESVRALTVAIRRGDAEAFARFYDRYSFRLYKYLLVLSRGDELAAREVGQAVFIKLARKLDAFDDENKLWAWLCTLARNAFIDHCRARQRDRFVSLDENSPPPGPDGGVVPPLSEILRETLASLPPDERELIQAAYVDERPLQELAEACGQTYKAVESRLARLRRKLKEQVLKHLRHENQS